MSAITTHVLDTAAGRPAAGVPIELEVETANGWQRIGRGATGPDGRLQTLLPGDAPLQAGTYRLIFDTTAYYRGAGGRTFYPRVLVEFTVAEGEAHYHVPLLLSPFGYSTYRGA